MPDDFVYRKNVMYEFYKAALSGEITQSEFCKAKEIIKRAKGYDPNADDDDLPGMT